jgi:hypothetical protein
MNNGTRTSSPVSSFATLVAPPAAVSPRTPGSVVAMANSTYCGSCRETGLSVVFEDIEVNTFLQIKAIVADAVFRKHKLLICRLIHEVKPIVVAIKKGYGGDLDVRFRKFLACSEALFLYRAVQQVLQPGSHHRAGTARRRRGEENIKHVIGLPFDLDQHLLFQLVRADECHMSYFTFLFYRPCPLCIKGPRSKELDA